jgi:hypothetical protein
LLDTCTLFRAIHVAVAADESQRSSYTSSVLDTGLVSATYGLLDLLILEGVYPSLAQGVGIQPERRKGSLLCNRLTKPSKNLDLLGPVIYDTLNQVIFGNEDGVKNVVADRVLIDLIAANADLAFSPARDNSSRKTALEILNKIFEK